MARTYRQAMFSAFAFPVALFVVLPLVIIGVVGPGTVDHTLSLLEAAVAVLIPLYAVGYLLAPWAGRSTPRTKAPAFVMAATSALAPVVALLARAAAHGETSGAYPAAAFFSFFALPASLLGALLFVGRCQRLHSGGRQ